MNTLKKTDSILKWIILGIAIANILSYFMPVFESVYRGGEPNLGYLYGGGSSYITVSFSSLLIPITAIVFLFCNFKNNKLFFFGFSATYIFSGIFIVLNISKSIANNDSDYYEYSLKYGYYIYLITLILLAIAIIGAFIIYLINKHSDTKAESEQLSQSSQDSKIETLKKKIEILDELKKQGILTEAEYEQKRSIIINELKI